MWLSALYSGQTESPKVLPRRKSTEPIGAFRTWRVAEDARGLCLASTAHDFVWDGPVLRDDSPPQEHEGHGAGSHGIHAYKNVSQANKHGSPGMGWGTYTVPLRFFTTTGAIYARPALTFLGGNVLGRVDLFGSVVVHEQGYRAQCAMIRSLYVCFDTWNDRKDIVEALAQRYGCEVFTDYVKWIGA
jgi:hypothetical protein